MNSLLEKQYWKPVKAAADLQRSRFVLKAPTSTAAELDEGLGGPVRSKRRGGGRGSKQVGCLRCAFDGVPGTIIHQEVG